MNTKGVEDGMGDGRRWPECIRHESATGEIFNVRLVNKPENKIVYTRSDVDLNGIFTVTLEEWLAGIGDTPVESPMLDEQVVRRVHADAHIKTSPGRGGKFFVTCKRGRASDYFECRENAWADAAANLPKLSAPVESPTTDSYSRVLAQNKSLLAALATKSVDSPAAVPVEERTPMPTGIAPGNGDTAERKLLVAAYDALRSYQFGNGSAELAEQTANAIGLYFSGGRP